MPDFKFATRCPAKLGNGECKSAIFYDWGLKMMTHAPVVGIDGNNLQKYDGWSSGQSIQICARCSTPYIVEEGRLVDVSVELGPEEVNQIISRGQTNLPHPKIKDP